MELQLGDCLYDKEGNAYRVESYSCEISGFADAILTVDMTRVKERTDMDFLSAADLTKLRYPSVNIVPAWTNKAKENDMDNEVKHFSWLTADAKKREFNEDITEAYGENLALFHECVMKTEDVEGVYVDGRNTTVKWADGSHTTVRCGEDDVFDPMIGFLLCVAKRHFGGTGRYLEVMRKHGVPECPKPTTVEIDLSKVGSVCFCA